MAVVAFGPVRLWYLIRSGRQVGRHMEPRLKIPFLVRLHLTSVDINTV